MPDYLNDPSILDEDDLWRRIRPDWVVFDENLGRARPTSQAFNNDRAQEPMSVDLAKIRNGPMDTLGN
jgi:hypothetical protein